MADPGAGYRSSPIVMAALLLAALLLAACASAPRHPGFYDEDGPPERVPSNVALTPDAVPREEPLNAFANRPYVALGRSYVPATSVAAVAEFHQRGIASWYGRQFQGNRTASGEPYDMFAMTAAHPTLPIPCYVRVTSVRDGRSVVVRVNDRGPFYRDRIIDLSYAAAVRLGLAGPGSGEVEVQTILPSQFARAASPAATAQGQAAASSLPIAKTAALSGSESTVVDPVAPRSPASAPASFAPAPAATDADPIARIGLQDPAPGSAAAPGPPAPSPAPVGSAPQPASPASALPAAAGDAQPGSSQWSVQLGAFAVAVNADALRDRLALLLSAPEAASLPQDLRAPRIERQGGLNRVLIGMAADRALAMQWARLLERYLARPTTLFVR